MKNINDKTVVRVKVPKHLYEAIQEKLASKEKPVKEADKMQTEAGGVDEVEKVQEAGGTFKIKIDMILPESDDAELFADTYELTANRKRAYGVVYEQDLIDDILENLKDVHGITNLTLTNRRIDTLAGIV